MKHSERRKKLKPRACLACKRILTDQKSIELGMGPTCRMKFQGGLQKELEKHGQLRLFE